MSSMGLESGKVRVCLRNSEKFRIAALWWEKEKSRVEKTREP